ncbi:MAG: hypothetical protein APF77_01235 [Clostridia bacterium BRH_c25]|nr:MAG: hypothetical protein APF77_01235 [Clostridia bacterium BRH_c25]
MNNVVFTPRWWILLVSLVIPWIVWYLLVYKKRLIEILIYIALLSGIFLLFDEVGNTLTLWIYPIKTVSLFPRLLPMCCSLSPLTYALIYQYFPKWKGFIFADIIASAVLSFIILPLATGWDYLIILNWKYIYSTFVFIISALISKLFIEIVNTIENRSTAQASDS